MSSVSPPEALGSQSEWIEVHGAASRTGGRISKANKQSGAEVWSPSLHQSDRFRTLKPVVHTQITTAQTDPPSFGLQTLSTLSKLVSLNGSEAQHTDITLILPAPSGNLNDGNFDKLYDKQILRLRSSASENAEISACTDTCTYKDVVGFQQVILRKDACVCVCAHSGL